MYTLGIRGETAFLAGVGTLTLGEWDNFDSREQEKRVLMNVCAGSEWCESQVESEKCMVF